MNCTAACMDRFLRGCVRPLHVTYLAGGRKDKQPSRGNRKAAPARPPARAGRFAAGCLARAEKCVPGLAFLPVATYLLQSKSIRLRHAISRPAGLLRFAGLLQVCNLFGSSVA